MAEIEKDIKEKLEPQVKSVDMSEDMQQEAIEVGKSRPLRVRPDALADNCQPRKQWTSIISRRSEIAHHIKRTFDERKGATWHCIVGRNFGSFVTHETKHFIYFYLGHCAILLFKTQ
ncbi:Dynein light chain, cytoplasmic [Teratosphaeria destructans]|uniref:Dynein light chain n=1 Tax=Teratosphaeria destructans TaxID=418781 RepID=A0A9W7SJT5_9PEZI|nr:Dynein light chain, cytoplasmic [Teratosphaeria destructans]